MRISRKLAAVAAFFMIAAVVAGCGSSSSNSIPSGSVASVAGNPISLAAVDHWMFIAAKDQAAQLAQQGQTEPVITAPDPPLFNDCIKQVRAAIATLAKTPTKTLRSDCKQVFGQFMPEVMAYLIEGYWYQADAHKLGVAFSAKEADKALAGVIKQFKTKAAYEAYLKSSGETAQDINFQIRVSGLYNKLLTHYQKPVTNAAIAAYYKSHTADFATQATRSGHLIRIKSASDAAAAVAALGSGTSWSVVAKKYAEDATSKTDAGLVTAVVPNTYEAAVNTVLFKSPLNKVVGPVKGVFGYYVLQVTAETPAVQKTLAQESATIKTTLETTAKTSAEAKVTAYSKATWGKQTLCKATYSVADCVGYKAPVTTPAVTPTPSTATTPASTATTSGSSTASQTATTTSAAPTSATSTAASTTSTTAG